MKRLLSWFSRWWLSRSLREEYENLPTSIPWVKDFANEHNEVGLDVPVDDDLLKALGGQMAQLLDPTNREDVIIADFEIASLGVIRLTVTWQDKDD